MIIQFLCSTCRVKLKVPAEHAGKKAQCPKCTALNVVPNPPREPSKTHGSALLQKLLPDASGPLAAALDEDEARAVENSKRHKDPDSRFFHADEVFKPCPRCNRALKLDEVFCVKCGYNLNTGEMIAPVESPEMRPETTLPYTASDRGRRSRKVTWSDILCSPFEVEAIAESAVLVIVTLGGALGILLCVSAAAFYSFVLGICFGVLVIPIMLGFAIAILYLELRLVSYVYGQYFAICRRAAYGALITERDAGQGFIDLGYALALVAFSFGPIFLVLRLFGPGDSAATLPGPTPSICLVLAILWAVFYFPMSVAVVALERSLNPLTVVRWISKSMPDYLVGVLLLGIFSGIIALGSWAVQYFVLTERVKFSTLIAILLGVSLNQYNVTACMTVIGMILRKNKKRIGWSESSDTPNWRYA